MPRFVQEFRPPVTPWKPLILQHEIAFAMGITLAVGRANTTLARGLQEARATTVPRTAMRVAPEPN